MAEREIEDLKSQVRDISELAREYRGEIQKLTTEINAFRRREPLVQLLWAEITQVKAALETAVQAGFIYDASEPTSRYCPLDALTPMAPISNLDVSKIQDRMTQDQHEAAVRRASLEMHDDSQGVANAMINDFILTASQPVASPSQSPEMSVDSSLASSPCMSPTMTSAPGLSALGSFPEAPLVDGGAPPAPMFDIPSAPSAPGAQPMAPGAPSFAPSAPSLIQPTKPVIKPAIKMKPIHWQRTILSDRQRSDNRGCLWTQIEKLSVVIDVRDLEANFSDSRPSLVPNKNATSEHKEEMTVAKEEYRVLSDKRFNAMSIALTSLPDIGTVVSAILNLDNAKLTADQLATLRKNMVGEEEIEALLSVPSAKISHLSNTEKFMRALAAIPAIAARLDCWHFKLHFNELKEEMSAPLQTIKRGVSSIKNSQSFAQLMALILTTGNIMNGSTVRGQADGFDISSLSRISSLRDNSNNTTLLTWLIDQAINQFGKSFLERFEAELSDAGLAAEFPLKQSMAAVTRFQSLVKTMRNTATLVCASIKNKNDPFLDTFAKFNSEAASVAELLNTEAVGTNNDYHEFFRFLQPSQAEAGKLMPSEELFALIRELRTRVSEEAQERRVHAEEEARNKRIEDAKRTAALLKAKQTAMVSEVEEQRRHQSSRV